MPDPEYDDTNMTEEEFECEFAAGSPAQLYSTREEMGAANPLIQIVEATTNITVVGTAPDSSWVFERIVGGEMLVNRDIPSEDQILSNVG